MMELTGGEHTQQAQDPQFKSQNRKGVGMMMYTCNPSTEEAEAGGKNESKAILGCTAKPHSKKQG